jgi:hypothetical protein
VALMPVYLVRVFIVNDYYENTRGIAAVSPPQSLSTAKSVAESYYIGPGLTSNREDTSDSFHFHNDEILQKIGVLILIHL